MMVSVVGGSNRRRNPTAPGETRSADASDRACSWDRMNRWERSGNRWNDPIPLLRNRSLEAESNGCFGQPPRRAPIERQLAQVDD